MLTSPNAYVTDYTHYVTLGVLWLNIGGSGWQQQLSRGLSALSFYS